MPLQAQTRPNQTAEVTNLKHLMSNPHYISKSFLKLRETKCLPFFITGFNALYSEANAIPKKE
jgi:hypothetical protein